MTEVGEATEATEASFEGSEGRVFYRRWDAAGPPIRIVQIVHGARHEVLNETSRDEVIGDLADWLELVAPA